MFLYLDASAIVKLVIQERETGALESALAHARAVFSSKLSVVECTRALARVALPRALVTLNEVFEAVVLHDINDAVLTRAGRLEPAALRSLDAIHLATALMLEVTDLKFVTYDERLAQAAAAQRLMVNRPGG